MVEKVPLRPENSFKCDAGGFTFCSLRISHGRPLEIKLDVGTGRKPVNKSPLILGWSSSCIVLSHGDRRRLFRVGFESHVDRYLHFFPGSEVHRRAVSLYKRDFHRSLKYFVSIKFNSLLHRIPPFRSAHIGDREACSMHEQLSA